jgi:glucose/arabinose dehydrogenase
MFGTLFTALRPAKLARRPRRRPVPGRPALEPLESRCTPTNFELPGFSETLVAGGMPNPTAMAIAPDGRIFVSQQGPGTASGPASLRVIRDGALLPTPFVTLTVDSRGERGLLGVTLDPDFANNGYVYVYHTVPGSPPHNQVSRFTADGDVALPGSEVDILDLNGLSGATNHNGGGLHFGPDGALYVSVGENANPPNAQNLDNRLGKILRINADGSIPDDNPTSFQSISGTTTGDNRAIWAVGFRNPYTFAVQPGTGRIFVNDVGSSPPNAREEINDLYPGLNYGWPIREGIAGDPNYTDPLYAYPSGVIDPDTGDFVCAIVGGTFYNPDTAQFPDLYTGTYFFSDLCGHWIKRFNPDTGEVQVFATGTPGNKVDLAVDSGGSLYYLSQDNGGRLYRVDYAEPSPAASDLASSPAFVRAALPAPGGLAGEGVLSRQPPAPPAGGPQGHEGVPPTLGAKDPFFVRLPGPTQPAASSASRHHAQSTTEDGVGALFPDPLR